MASIRRRSRNKNALDDQLSVNTAEDQPTLLLLNDILSSIAHTSGVSAAASSGRNYRSRRRPLPQGRNSDDASEADGDTKIPLARRSAQNESSDGSSPPNFGNALSSAKEHGTLASTSTSKDDAIPESFQRRMRQRDRTDRLGQDKSVSTSSVEKSSGAKDTLAQDTVQSKAPTTIDVASSANPTTLRNPKGNFKENVKTISSKGIVAAVDNGDDDDEEEEGTRNGAGFKHSENDQAAMAAQSEFEVELAAWVNARMQAHQQPCSAASKDSAEGSESTAVAQAVSAEPAHRREAFASYLSARYLCSRLDPLEKSPVVTSVRRRVARATDNLAAGKNPLQATRTAGAVTSITSSGGTSKTSTNSSSSGGGSVGGRSHNGSNQSDNHAWLRGPNKPSAQRHSASAESSSGSSVTSSSSSVVAEIAAMRRAEAEKQQKMGPFEQRGGQLVKHPGGVKGKGKAHWCTVRDGDWTCGTCSKRNYDEDDHCSVCARDKPCPAPPPKPQAGPLPVPKHMGAGPNSEHAFTEEEREANEKMEKIKAEYTSFVRTKLHLDNHASVRRNFADDIKGVLSGFNSSSLNGDGGKAAQAPLVAPAAVGTVWRDEKGEVQTKDHLPRNPFLRDKGSAQVSLKGTRDPMKA